MDSTVATRLATASKCLSRVFTGTFWSQRILLLAKKALEAASKRWVRSNAVLPAFPTPRMHPNRLCPPDPFLTYNLISMCVHKCDGGWAWLVNTTVFSPFSNPLLQIRASNFPRGKVLRAQYAQKVIYHRQTLGPRVSANHFAGQYHILHVQHRAPIFA